LLRPLRRSAPGTRCWRSNRRRRPAALLRRLGLPIEPSTDGTFEAISPNVKLYGAIYSAESCSYDPARGVIVVPNRGVGQNVETNNVWVSLINHDGSVHTPRWIGIQNPGDARTTMTPPLVLNEPLGSDIVNNMLYVADRDGGTSPNEPTVSVVRRFNLQTGAPAGEIRVERSTGFNDIEVAEGGTIYGTQTGAGGQTPIPPPGRCARSRRAVRRRSSSRARRSGSRTAPASTRRATSS
jgi:hypothetical protein